MSQSLNQIVEGLQVLGRYYDGARPGSRMEAKQDIIEMDVTDRPLSAGDVERMIELGWFQPECQNIKSADEYDPEDFWRIHP